MFSVRKTNRHFLLFLFLNKIPTLCLYSWILPLFFSFAGYHFFFGGGEMLGLDLTAALEIYELLIYFFPGWVSNLRPKYSLVVVREAVIVKGQLQGCQPIYLFFSLGFTEKEAIIIWWSADVGEKRIDNVACSMPNLERARLVLVTNGLKLLLLGYFIWDK